MEKLTRKLAERLINDKINSYFDPLIMQSDLMDLEKIKNQQMVNQQLLETGVPEQPIENMM
jgi:hypothetical protein